MTATLTTKRPRCARTSGSALDRRLVRRLIHAARIAYNLADLMAACGEDPMAARNKRTVGRTLHDVETALSKPARAAKPFIPNGRNRKWWCPRCEGKGRTWVNLKRASCPDCKGTGKAPKPSQNNQALPQGEN